MVAWYVWEQCDVAWYVIYGIHELSQTYKYVYLVLLRSACSIRGCMNIISIVTVWIMVCDLRMPVNTLPYALVVTRHANSGYIWYGVHVISLLGNAPE